MSFNTSGVKSISRVNAYAGIADVYLDGVKKATVDLYSPTTKYQQVVWQISGLPGGQPHDPDRQNRDQESQFGCLTNMLLDAFSAPDIYAPAAPSAVQVTAQGTGASITWTKSPEPDTAGYQVLRADPGATFYTLIGTTAASITSFADIGLGDATTTGSRSSLATGVTISPHRRRWCRSPPLPRRRPARCATRTARQPLRPSPPGRSW